MKYILYIIYALILGVAMYGLFALIPFGRAVPNLFLLALVGMLIVTDDIDILCTVAVAGGIFLDVYAGFAFGTFTLGLMLVTLLLYSLQQHVLLAANRIRYLPLLLLAGHILLEVWGIAYAWSLGQFVPVVKTVLHPYHISVVSLYRLGYNFLLLYPVYITVVAIDNLLSSINRRFKIHS